MLPRGVGVPTVRGSRGGRDVVEAVPQIVANCKVLGLLGQGGMGSVFRSVHMTLGRRMAIKVLPAEFTRSPEYVSRFLREARTIANLNHPNIVLVHDAGEQNGIYYIAMELVDGASLAAVTRHSSRLPEPVALDFLAQSARGLGYAHDRGLVHRDIKPENLLINREGTLKVVDFGLVLEEASQSHLTRSGTFLGTPTFMSPEQCDGDVADARSDLYALGATFYCALTGHAPFTGSTALGIMYKHKFEAPPPLDGDISAQTSAIILKLLAKKREDRYQTAKELSADVANAARTVPPRTDWSLDQVLGIVAPPQPEPTAEELSAIGRGRSSETVAMQELRGRPAGGESSSASPGSEAAGTLPPGRTPAPGSISASAWDPTLIAPRTPLPRGALNTPAPSPLPGLPTPAPGGRASRTGLWVGAAAALLLGIGAGGYFFYRSHRRSQLEGYVKAIESLRQSGSLDDAHYELRQAMSGFPDEPRLNDLRQSLAEDIRKKAQRDREINLQFARKEVRLDDWVKKAKAAFEGGRFDEAILGYQEARKLDPDSEELKTGLDAAHLAHLRARVAEAEKNRKWEDALSFSKQSLEFGGTFEQVQRLEQRVKVEELRQDALRLSRNDDLLAAADRFDEAALSSTRDTAVRDELQQLAVQQRTQHHLNRATEAEKQGQWTGAIAALNKALKLAPKDAAIEKRLEHARRSFRNETSFESAMSLGRKALDAQRWSEAAEMYRAAIGHNQDHSEAKALLTEAIHRDVLSQADTKVQTRAWREASALLDEIEIEVGKTAQTGVKIEFERLSMLVRNNREEISRKETRAQTAAKEDALATAIQEFEALIDLNPADRTSYETALAPLRIEHAYRGALADGDGAASAGQFAKARTAYRQAGERKKDDATAQATVKARLALMVASEKLFKVEPLIAEKNWGEARTQLAAIQKEIPADNTIAATAVDERLKAVDGALAQIDALEETGRTAVPHRKWEDGREALKQLQELNPSRKDAYRKQLDDLETALKAFNEQTARQARYDLQMGEARRKLGQEDFDGAIASAGLALEAIADDPPAKDLIKDARDRKDAKARAMLINDTHRNLQGLVEKGQLDQAASLADTTAKQNATVTELNSMAAALKEMRDAKRAVALASKPLDDSMGIVSSSPVNDRQRLQRAIQSAKEKWTQQEAEAVRQFVTRDYAAAQNTASTLSTGALNQTRSTIVGVATTADQLGDEAARSTPHRRNIGEMGVEGGNSDADAQKKALPYRSLSKKLRDLAAGIR